MATSNSPLTPPAFFVLFALADGDKHGYGIMRDIRKLSNETVNLGPATLYTTIQRLLDRRWIREVPSPDGSDIRRRYYRLTSEGRLVFSGELKRMEFIVKKSKAMRLRPSELC